MRLPLEGPAELDPKRMELAPTGTFADVAAHGEATDGAGQAMHGKARPFWACVGLGVVTLGIYFWVWQLRVFREVDQQERRPGWAWLWWLVWVGGFIGGLGVIASFQAVAQGDVAPQDFRLPTWWIPWVTILSALFCLYIALESRSLDRGCQRVGVARPPIVAVVALLAALQILALIDHAFPAVVQLIILVPFGLIPYGLLQGALNRYWQGVAKELDPPVPEAHRSAS
ncbi:MAG: DUF4234 domain-containing protein [Thermoplasmatota archaeon]